MTSPDPFNFPQSWDQIQINGIYWGGPHGLGGKITILGATRFYKVDQKDGSGLDGATQTYRGVKPKPFKLVFAWWNAEQHAGWAFLSQMFIYTGSKPGALPPVFSVYHPALALLSISSILVDEVSAVEVHEDTKIAKATVTVRQFYPPPPTGATTTPSSAPPSPPPTPTGLPAPTAEQALLQAQLYTTRAVAAGGVPSSLPH
jgi:hypothetical protein